VVPEPATFDPRDSLANPIRDRGAKPAGLSTNIAARHRFARMEITATNSVREHRVPLRRYSSRTARSAHRARWASFEKNGPVIVRALKLAKSRKRINAWVSGPRRRQSHIPVRWSDHVAKNSKNVPNAARCATPMPPREKLLKPNVTVICDTTPKATATHRAITQLPVECNQTAD